MKLYKLLTHLICAVGLWGTAACLASPLVHRYSFNDGTARDSVGKADGTVVGNVQVSDGQATFHGVAGERIELRANGKDGINVNLFKAVTIEAWYTIGPNPGRWQRLFDFGASTGIGQKGSDGGNYLLFSPATALHDDCRAVISNSMPGYKTQIFASGPSATPGRKTHATIVVNDKTLTVYIDGVQVAQEELEKRSLAGLANDWALLGHSLYGSDAPFTGAIDEFRIYDIAASAEQVAASFKAGPSTVVIK